MSGYPDDAFIVVSADNLDLIHSYTRVYCGNQQSSWHGTTIQLELIHLTTAQFPYYQ